MRFEGVMPDGTKRFETATGQPIHHYAGVSTFASFSTMPDAAVVKIPDDYGFEHAGLLSCGVITGVGAVTRAARIDPGCTVAVFGVGGIGLNIVQGARMMSARRIIAVDVHASKEAKAREMGATDFVLAEEGTDPVAAVRSLTGGLGVDYAFESVGLAAPVEQAYDSTRKGGTCVVAGIMRPDARARININQLVYAEKTLKGTPAGPHFSSRPGRLRSAEHSRRPQTNAGAGRSTTSHHPAIRQSPRIPGGAGPAIKRTADAVDLGSQGAACGCEISLGKTAKAQRAQRGRKGNSWRARNFLAKRDKMLELIFAS
jgi:NADPH:quinone reductase-like Zn-dependent oxidoreductase